MHRWGMMRRNLSTTRKELHIRLQEYPKDQTASENNTHIHREETISRAQ